jgi:hypothetical protein
MDGEHGRVTSQGLRVSRGPSEDLAQVPREVLQVLRVSRVRERMIEDRVLEATLVEGAGERGEGGFTSDIVIDGRPYVTHVRSSRVETSPRQEI